MLQFSLFYAVNIDFMTFPVILSSVLLRNADNNSSSYTLYVTLWFVFASIDIVYKYTWDIFCDWGLGSFHNGFLRPPLRDVHSGKAKANELNHIFPNWWYYSAMTVNAALRLSSPILVSDFGVRLQIEKHYTYVIIALLEVLRRGICK